MHQNPENIVYRDNSDPPKVTIGVPVYNGEHFIREALGSLLAQIFTNFELLISDNASTDATSEICMEYAGLDSRIRYIRQEENRGAFWNITFVMENGRGDYLMIAGDDDVYSRDYLSTMLDLLGDDSDIGLAYSNCSYIDDVGNRQPFNLKKFLSQNDSKSKNVSRYILSRNCLPMMMGVFRSKVLLRALPFPSDYLSPMTGDVDNLFLVKLLSLTRVASTDRVLFYYRIKDRKASFPGDWPKGFWLQQLYMLRHHYRVSFFMAHTIWSSDFTVASRCKLIVWNWLVFHYHFAFYFIHNTINRIGPSMKRIFQMG